MLKLARDGELPETRYENLGEGCEFVVYPGGVGPGKSTLNTRIPIRDNFELLIGASDQSAWAKAGNDFEDRFVNLVKVINEHYNN